MRKSGIITHKRGGYMAAVHRQNISVDPVVFEEFCNYAGRKGIKISTWVSMKMQEFIEDEKRNEEIKIQRKQKGIY